MNWEWLGRITDVLAVLTVIFSGYAAFRLYQQNKRLRMIAQQFPTGKNFKELIAAHEGINSLRPVAVAVSLTPTSTAMKGHVTTFLRSKGWEMPIVELNMDGINDIDDMEKLLKDLIVQKREVEASGYTEVHLFIAGPMPACVQVGAVFDNWLPVKLYHKPQPAPPQMYEYWMPLIK